MESAGKQGSSDDGSSEENDRVDQVKGGDTASITAKRSYECCFCKRGFTNARALGGHMNIHRKDRAKAKQLSSSSVPSDQPTSEEYMNPSYLPQISNQLPTKYFPVLEAQRNTNHMYFQPSVSSPSFPYGYHDHSDFVVPTATSSQSLTNSMNEELWGGNLSLQIGPTQVDEDEVRRGIVNEDEVDLELRLGHYP